MVSPLLWLSARLKWLTLGEMIRRHPRHYPRAQQLFSEPDPAARAEQVRRRLDLVLQVAGQTRYGRSVGAPPGLGSWPYIDKTEVRADTRAFYAKEGWAASAAKTSGTTGTPLTLIRSTESLAYEQAAIDSVLVRLGVQPRRARVAVLRGDVVKTAPGRWWKLSQRGQRLTLSSYHLSKQTVAVYAEALQAFRPDVLLAYPSMLESLCRLLAATGSAVQIPRVVCSSELLCPSTWQLAREVLGCTMADYYGQAERVAFASAVGVREYRFVPGYSYVELLRTGTEGAESTYEIVGTPLWNLSMPLVRYRTGDLLRLPASVGEHELAEICLGVRPFAGILGRSADVLLLPDGPRLTAINHIPRDVSRIVALQILQVSLQDVRIRVLPGPRYDAAEGEAFLERARSVLPVTMTVTIEPTEALERSALGKIPVIVHSAAVREQLASHRGRSPGG